jgi:hypothetical protein
METPIATMLLLLPLALLAAPSAAEPSSRATAAKPNFIFVLGGACTSSQQCCQACSCYRRQLAALAVQLAQRLTCRH